MVRSPISSMPQDIPLVGTGWELSSEMGTRLPARVPNDISDDLEQAGLLPPLFYGTNSMFGGNWTLNRTWTLSRNISLPRVRAGASGVLRFEGVDYNASIRINGKLVATHVGAFEPFEVVLSSHDLRVQTLSLAVTLHPPPPSVTWPLYATAWPPGWGAEQCVWNQVMHPYKSRLVYISDAVGTINMAAKHWARGIWRNVSLRLLPTRARLDRQISLTATINSPRPLGRQGRLQGTVFKATVQARVRWSSAAVDASPGESRYRLRVSARCITNATAPEASGEWPLAAPSSLGVAEEGERWMRANVSITIEDAKLWWPNGYGRQDLYHVVATLLVCSSAIDRARGTDHERCSVVDAADEPSFGIRRLEEVQNDLEASGRPYWFYTQFGQPGGPWTLNSSSYNRRDDPLIPNPRQWLFVVNGVRVFARGGNWVPSDHFFGRAVREQPKLRALLGMARAAGFTFVRVWGGGLVEDQSFYRLCDEFGLLVQQDFPQAGCAPTPPWRPADVLSWSRQVPGVLEQLANHPSVARYTMGNELYLNASFSKITAAFAAAARLHDPSRVAREADPTCIGQRHGPYIWSFIGEQVTYDTFELGCNLAVEPHPGQCRYNAVTGGAADPFEWTEFGHPALADVATLRRIMPENALMPTGVAPEWGWHSGSASGWLAKHSYEAVFLSRGTKFTSLLEEVRASQWTQAEALRFALQSARRKKWHRSLMSFWTFNEPWPNSAYGNVIDYYGLPKMGYWWVADACDTLMISLAYRDLVAVADGVTPLGGGVAVWLDSEESDAVEACCAKTELFYANGTLAAPAHVHPLPGGVIAPGKATKLHEVSFVPTLDIAGQVLFVRLSLLGMPVDTQVEAEVSHPSTPALDTLLSQSTYAIRLVVPGQNASNVRAPLAPLLMPPHATLQVREEVWRPIQMVNAGKGAAVHARLQCTAPDLTSGSSTNRRCSRIRVEADAGSAVALYVTLSVRDARTMEQQQAFVAFERNAFVLLPGESVTIIMSRLLLPPTTVELPSVVCAEAWNVERTCAQIKFTTLARSPAV